MPAAADLNGDGRAEVLVENGGTITVSAFDAASGSMVAAGIEITRAPAPGPRLPLPTRKATALPEIINRPPAGDEELRPGESLEDRDGERRRVLDRQAC